MVRTTSKALLCRTTLFFTVLATAAVVSVSSEFFFRPIKPLIFVQKPNGPQVVTRANRPTFSSDEQLNHRAPQPPAQGRSDLPSSSEEEQGDESSAEYDDKPNQNRTELPASFEEDVRRNRPAVEPGRRGPLYGDPAVMEEDTEEQDRSRYLWPFSTSITVSKTKNHPRPHHHHHLSYHDYVEQMYNQAQGHSHGSGWDGDDVEPLTDEEILHSKGIFSARQAPAADSSAEEATSNPKSTVTDTVTSWGSALLPTNIFHRIRTSLPFGPNHSQNHNQNSRPTNKNTKKKHHLRRPAPLQKSDFDDDDDNDDDVDQESQQQQDSPPAKNKPTKGSTTKPSTSYFQLPQLQTLFRLRRPFLKFPSLTGSSSKKEEETQQKPQHDQQSEGEAQNNEDEEDREEEADDEEDDEEEEEEQEDDQEAAGSGTGASEDNENEDESDKDNEEESNNNENDDEADEEEDGQNNDEEQEETDNQEQEETENREQQETRRTKDKPDLLKSELSDDILAELDSHQPVHPATRNQFRHGNPIREQLPATPVQKPEDDKTKKMKKKMKFKEKIYSVLYNTMDVLDKTFAEPEQDDELE